MSEIRAPASPTPQLAGVVTCFVLSGFAALLYQTAWLRQFSLAFGTSDLAVATVLAAYMAGLALGAAVAGRAVGRIQRPILIYALLEAGIAFSALCVPLLLNLAGDLYALMLGGRPEPPDAASLGQPAFYLGVGFLVLAIPTSFMGATLPLLTRHAVSNDRELGPRVALLYATNTAGAVLGALAAGFALLPNLGLEKTVWCGVAVNALVFVVAAALSHSSPALEVVATVDTAGASAPRFESRASWILPLMLLSGATAFFYEVLWTRLLTHVLGGSVYAFSTMLATFLTGIALGSAAAGRWAKRREQAAYAFAIAQLGIAALSMGVYAWMGPLLPEGRGMTQMVGFAMAVMLPATLFIGSTFPLAVRIVARDEFEAGAATARVYAWNTLGGIAGALLAGFWLLPALGFEGSIRLAICMNLLLALLCLAGIAGARPVWTGAVALGLLATLVSYQPDRPQAVVAQTGYLPAGLAEPFETFYAVGRSATVLVVDDGESHWLLTNGLSEASIASRGTPPERDTQKWLTALAVAARPDLESMLVVGFGGGVSLGGVPASVRRVDVVELEPEVIRANRTLSGVRATDPLADARVQVILNDARNALRLTDRRYDAIVSQPSHPWTAGASHLFTREFLQIAKAHLNDGGVFVQWMGAEFVSATLLRSLAATVLAEFGYARLYRPASNSLLFLASDAPLEPELELARSGRPIRDEPRHFQRLGMASVDDLIASLVTSGAGLREFAAGAPVITDDDNRMAMQSRGGDGLTPPQLDTLFAPYDPLLDPESWIHRRLGDALSFPHLARRLIRLGESARARSLSKLLEDEATRSLVLAEIQAESGDPDSAIRAARVAAAADANDMQARYLLFRLQLPQSLVRARETNDFGGLKGPARAVVRAWQLAREQRWSALAALDEELSRSRVTDVWYPDAMLLRARWRTFAGSDRQRLVSEALELVDSAWLLGRDLRLPLERLRIASALGDDAVLVESARSVVALFRTQLLLAEAGMAPLPPPERAAMRQNLSHITQALDRVFPAINQHRARIVLAAARENLRRLDALPQGSGRSRR